MPLQNRVHPNGNIVATPERGTMLGNRGGKFHRDDKTIGKRRWASHHWICCELHYKQMHHDAMGKGYTSLFFLDEITALSVGHRPCFFCRRAEAKAFVALSELTTEALDRKLHEERLAERPTVKVSDLPDGAIISVSGNPFAVLGQNLLHWSFGGYGEIRSRDTIAEAILLTPRTITAILQAGFKPRWHQSAFSRGMQ